VDWADVIVQLPIVGAVLAFVIFWSDRMDKAQAARDKAFREFITEQRANDREILGRLVSAVERVEANLNAHDDRTNKAIATMEERTRPTRRAKAQ
jgi:hypothetical protein